MKIQDLIKIIDVDFFTGVPDSQLKPLCDYLLTTYPKDNKHHLIAANEGNAVALATGYHLATHKFPLVYLQNSGEGNIINPVASLCNQKVYGIPMIFVIGWRGEPGVHDEPQHVFQGEITLKLLDDLGIKHFIISPETTSAEIIEAMNEFKPLLESGSQVAFVVKKGGLEFDQGIKYQNPFHLRREEAIERIIKHSGDNPIVSTTGKTSRELFELREKHHQSHEYDFLTVGSMGHSSSIALGIALQKPHLKTYLIDGDGAALMHMGSLAVIGSEAPENLVHIIINNQSHESVGGQPTATASLDLPTIARGCGYQKIYSVDTLPDLDQTLTEIKSSAELCFLEIKCAIGARPDLGRPTTTPIKNKNNFMQFLSRSHS